MGEGLTSTRGFGFSAGPAGRLVAMVASGEATAVGADPALAQRIGLGTVQLEGLGAWLRLAGFLASGRGAVALTPLGEVVHRHDPGLGDPCTWWVLHWELSKRYPVWGVMSGLSYEVHDTGTIDAALAAAHPGTSDRTIRNARLALLRALSETPLGQSLGIVSLSFAGGDVAGLEKRSVRHGEAPTAAVGYALLDWAREGGVTSAPLDVVARGSEVGGRLHMSDGVLERYAMELDQTLQRQAISYSRTAGLEEIYFKPDVEPLALLRARYTSQEQGITWCSALVAARGGSAGDAR